jgi:hypothetical protein
MLCSGGWPKQPPAKMTFVLAGGLSNRSKDDLCAGGRPKQPQALMAFVLTGCLSNHQLL